MGDSSRRYDRLRECEQIWWDDYQDAMLRGNTHEEAVQVAHQTTVDEDRY